MRSLSHCPPTIPYNHANPTPYPYLFHGPTVFLHLFHNPRPHTTQDLCLSTVCLEATTSEDTLLGHLPTPVISAFSNCLRLPSHAMVYEAPVPPTVQACLFGSARRVAPEIHRESRRVLGLDTVAHFDYSAHHVFALGLLVYEVCTGEHPLKDYPFCLEYSVEDVGPLPLVYPKDLLWILRQMLDPDPSKRPPLRSAVDQLRVLKTRAILLQAGNDYAPLLDPDNPVRAVFGHRQTILGISAASAAAAASAAGGAGPSPPVRDRVESTTGRGAP